VSAEAGYPALMCNLYSLTKGQPAIRDLFSARNDRTGNLPLFPAIFPTRRRRSFGVEWLRPQSRTLDSCQRPSRQIDVMSLNGLVTATVARLGLQGKDGG
jgi:hypothetical protein